MCRYLRLCFYQAFGHVRPHVVIFLGDLLDEGSLASDEEYTSYVQRFNTVFQTSNHIQVIRTLAFLVFAHSLTS